MSELNDDFIRPHIRALAERGNITVEEHAELRCNSYEWELLVPALNDEAFAVAMQHALNNSRKTEARPFVTYDMSVLGMYGPEALKRLVSASREAKTFAETIDNVRAALGQDVTHYLVIADDVKELVEAVEVSSKVGGRLARETLARIRDRGRKYPMGLAEIIAQGSGPGFTEHLFPGLLDLERTPNGYINNCALACSDEEKNCQMCKGQCPDRSRFE